LILSLFHEPPVVNLRKRAKERKRQLWGVDTLQLRFLRWYAVPVAVAGIISEVSRPV